MKQLQNDRYEHDQIGNSAQKAEKNAVKSSVKNHSHKKNAASPGKSTLSANKRSDLLWFPPNNFKIVRADPPWVIPGRNGGSDEAHL